MNNNEVKCPIYFENHDFGGNVTSIENFTNVNFGNVRTTIINGKPYFCAVDICRGLFLDIDKTSRNVYEATSDIINSFNNTPATRWRGYLNYELYYYLNIEVTHKGNNYSLIKQTVRTIFISEPVLYMLMFKSRKREAINFKAWLAVEILPNMRLIDRNKSIQFLHNEANNIADQISDLNNKYNQLVNISGQIIQKQSNDDNYFYFELQDIKNRLNSIGSDIMCEEYNIDNKITDIASGLNKIFG